MNYPKEIILDNDKLKELINKKGELVEKGRAKSREIEKLEEVMAKTEKELMKAEKKVDLKEFVKDNKAITKRMEACIKDMDKQKKKIYDKIKKETPQELRDKYDEAEKSKEKLENERNKIALKAQKFNDKIIPLGRELMKTHLQDEFEDYDTMMIKDGEIKATIFSHLEDFKIRFNKKRKV